MPMCFPYFRRRNIAAAGAVARHGRPFTSPAGRHTRSDAFVKSAEAELSATPDLTAIVRGFGPADMTVWKGRRCRRRTPI